MKTEFCSESNNRQSSHKMHKTYEKSLDEDVAILQGITLSYL